MPGLGERAGEISAEIGKREAYLDAAYALGGIPQNVASIVGCCAHTRICQAGTMAKHARRPVSVANAAKNLLGLPTKRHENGADRISTVVSCSFAILNMTSLALRLTRLVHTDPLLDKAFFMTFKPVPYFGVFLRTKRAHYKGSQIIRGEGDLKDGAWFAALTSDIVGIAIGLCNQSKLAAGFSLLAELLTIGLSVHTIVKSSSSKKPEDHKSES